ncbi:MAG: hypothetical protein IJ867_02725 [Clostridia bacterium]|nr:hypothetical protein [Clostridia bacterium]
MEEENVIKEVKGSYLTGLIGAVVGAIIATIPWVLVYVYLQYILSVLAMLVAFGAFYGYKIGKGKMGKGVTAIVVIVSLLAIVGATLGVIPAIIATQNDYEISAVYQNEEFMSGLYTDLAVSMLFAILGIAAAIPSIKMNIKKASGVSNAKDEVAQKQEELIEAQVNSKLKGKKREEVDIVRNAFKQLNAYTKETAVSKEEIVSAMQNEKAEKLFKKYKNLGIIAKYKESYYYDKTKEVFLTNNIWTSLIWVVMIVVIVSIVTSSGTSDTSNSSSIAIKKSATYSTESGDIEFQLPSDWISDEVDYISEAFIYDPNGNASVYIAYTDKAYFEGQATLEDLKDTLESYIEENYNVEDIGTVTKANVQDYDAYKIDFNYVDDSGLKTHATVYNIETENYFVELYQYTKKSKQNDYKVIFENMINTLKEK